ncbi:hypothetical protein SEUCBS139899_004079 [Sporothrix eucalyptigena]|uniref:Zn(2)-C6 fungal-type domain-containing protein n=1 Tax=Sporothrix eucalyptigena TaxID=1812306 RepID=A0ABP0BEN3_9PEZI
MAPKSRRVPQELRQRTEKSCDRCKSRKQKCGMVPGQEKCAHCVKYGYECLITKPRKQRLYGSVEAHAERLMLLEGLVKHFVPEADLANTDGVKELAQSLGIPVLMSAVGTSTGPRESGRAGFSAEADANGDEAGDADISTEAGADTSNNGSSSRSHAGSLVKAKKDNEMLVRDLQGQGQYIGQASSFFFQVRLRDALETWIGRDSGSAGSPSSTGTPGRMLLFGPNPADTNRRRHSSYNGFDNMSDLDGMRDTVDLVSFDHLDGPNLTLHFPLSLSDLLPSLPAAERWTVTQLLVRTFFDRINNDFPVLHEATFLEQLSAWSRRPQETDQAWICTLLCVLMLAWRLVAPASVATSSSTSASATTTAAAATSSSGPNHSSSSSSTTLPTTVELHEFQEARWWHQAQALLPKVLFTSSMTSVQALMLTALHLHNNNSRDVCWTLTGAAVRIGFAIGLHRDDVVETTPLIAASSETNTTTNSSSMTPVSRELRKRVWWTLYAFEQLQVSSHDRPSAIDSTKHRLAGTPRETILDMGAHNPPEYVVWSNRLVALLGSACRTLPDTAQLDETTSDKASQLMGPLSPAAGLLRDLTRWNTTLPRHLSADLIDAMPPSFQRPLLLLHVQFNYVSALVSRYALLSRFTAVSKRDPLVEPMLSMSDVCIQSGRHSCELLLKLDAVGGFNALTWMDVYYLYSSVLIVVLALVCEASQRTAAKETTAAGTAAAATTTTSSSKALAELRQLLSHCKNLAAKHLANPVVPGTMRRWLTVVGELDVMAGNFITKRRSEAMTGDIEALKHSSDHESSRVEGEAASSRPNENIAVDGDATSPTQLPPLMTPSPDGGDMSDVEEVPRPVYYSNNDYNSNYNNSNASNNNRMRRDKKRSRQADRQNPHYNSSNSHHARRMRGDSRHNNHIPHHTQQPLLPPALSLATLSSDTMSFPGDTGRQLMISSTSTVQQQQAHQGRVLGNVDGLGSSNIDMASTADANGFFLASVSSGGWRGSTPSIADPVTVAATAAAATAHTNTSTNTMLDADDYGPFQAAADAAEAGMWHEMHWEGISDLLLGVEPRSWNA